jgi:hypothetical protein
MSFGKQEDQNAEKAPQAPEEIVAKLRQVDVLVSQGQSVADAVRAIGVTEVTYYLSMAPGIWRPEERSGSEDEGA